MNAAILWLSFLGRNGEVPLLREVTDALRNHEESMLFNQNPDCGL